jgi:hypothetical protein
MMKRIWMPLLAGMVLAGCAGNGELLKRAEIPERSNIYTVISPAILPEQGSADLTIRASVKTHSAGQFLLGKDPHGTTDYVLLVNIDGEPLRIPGAPAIEEGFSDAERHPEAGDGTRYLFRAHLRLKAGSHRVIVALPEDRVAIQRDILLDERTDSLLEVSPSYYSDRRQTGPGSAGATSFREGISGLELMLNGKAL